MTMGMVAILGNKFKNSKSFVPSTIHSTVAVFTIIAILAQVYVGIEKMSSIQKIRRWHGNAGLLTWDLLVLTSLLGLVQFLHFNIFNTCACMALLLVWFAVHIQFREEVSTIKSAESDADNGLLIADADEHNV